MSKTTLHPKLEAFCQSLVAEFDQVNPDHLEPLDALSKYISGKIKKGETPKVIAVCTHNSRRSHLAQLWLHVAAAFYDLKDIETYSGGTEATAFNPRAVKAMQEAGFEITANDLQSENPVYQIKISKDIAPYLAFSKKTEHIPNPQEGFCALMVCSHADENCPFVPGAEQRISLPFNDPKDFDDTELERQKYAERVREIGREMIFVVKNAFEQLN